MTGLNFEGDLSQINELQLKFIKSIIEQRGYKNSKVIIEPVGKAGDNYVANVKRITVDDENGRTFKMVAKIAPSNVMLRNMANTEMLFRNEVIMYTKVLPKLTQFEITADVPPQERLRYAACYGCFSVVPYEVILLEDLNESNFVMLDRMQPLNPDCIKSVLKNFASLHSFSYALKNKEPQLFEEFKDSLFDTWEFMSNQEQTKGFGKLMEMNSMRLMDNDIRKTALNGAIFRCFKDYAKFLKFDKHSKHAIIQQGDAWTNNLMFKFDGDTLLESVMIDYQVSKVTSPVADIFYMIFNCTNHEMRKVHFYEWIDYYHSELDKALSKYDLKANFVYPKDNFDADMRRFGKISFGQCLFLAGGQTAKPEEAGAMMKAVADNDVQKIMEAENGGLSDPETIGLYKKRIEDLVDSFQEFGLI